ncbi:hypothetical protein [Haloarcula montana]|uniref:hypothetical protein n=1 Tax=Haloarcula montana TaxID=3111776 RepID=UPI002D7752F3|nr:hypothetical protein [Haloarcula sp. GH36]
MGETTVWDFIAFSIFALPFTMFTVRAFSYIYYKLAVYHDTEKTADDPESEEVESISSKILKLFLIHQAASIFGVLITFVYYAFISGGDTINAEVAFGIAIFLQVVNTALRMSEFLTVWSDNVPGTKRRIVDQGFSVMMGMFLLGMLAIAQETIVRDYWGSLNKSIEADFLFPLFLAIIGSAILLAIVSEAALHHLEIDYDRTVPFE